MLEESVNPPILNAKYMHVYTFINLPRQCVSMYSQVGLLPQRAYTQALGVGKFLKSVLLKRLLPYTNTKNTWQIPPLTFYSTTFDNVIIGKLGLLLQSLSFNVLSTNNLVSLLDRDFFQKNCLQNLGSSNSCNIIPVYN